MREIFHPLVIPTVPLVEGNNPEVSPASLGRWQEPKYLSPHCRLPSEECVGRKLELKAQAGLELSYSSMGFRLSKLSLNYPQHSP